MPLHNWLQPEVLSTKDFNDINLESRRDRCGLHFALTLFNLSQIVGYSSVTFHFFGSCARGDSDINQVVMIGREFLFTQKNLLLGIGGKPSCLCRSMGMRSLMKNLPKELMEQLSLVKSAPLLQNWTGTIPKPIAW